MIYLVSKDTNQAFVPLSNEFSTRYVKKVLWVMYHFLSKIQNRTVIVRSYQVVIEISYRVKHSWICLVALNSHEYFLESSPSFPTSFPLA